MQTDLSLRGQTASLGKETFSGSESLVSEARRGIVQGSSLAGKIEERLTEGSGMDMRLVENPRESISRERSELRPCVEPESTLPLEEIFAQIKIPSADTVRNIPEKELEGEVALHRRLFPPRPGSFQTTEIAAELVSVFEDLGHLSKSDFLRECLLGGNGIDDRFGNGLASLSRKLYNSRKYWLQDFRKDDSGIGMQDQLKSLGVELGRILERHYNTGSEATRLIIDQLRDIAGISQERPNLPDFRRTKEISDKSCGDVELAFVKAIKQGMFSKDELFIYKSFGAETALNRVPITVDGMLVPVGTLCFVEKNGSELRVTPMRHTMFSLPEDQARVAYDSHYRTIRETYALSDQDINAVYREMRPDLPDTGLKASFTRLLKLFADYFSSSAGEVAKS